MKLYAHDLSGHSHRARLFAALAGIEIDLVNVDLAAGEHKKPEFLALNPFGQLPVLDDDGALVPDSNAIMVYLAKKFGKTEWLPEDAAGAARVQRWLSVAAGQIAFGPAAARLITVFGSKTFRAEEVIARAHGVLKLIEAELQGGRFIAAQRATIADIALYSYIARAPEGNVDLADYPAVRAWLARIEALPGFVAFARTPVGLAA
ncbi:MAG: glutathione S-transferase [Beijerinckiaceae bacterium]|nr:glutathione S-transferase [Beijerinckiaceae bacterium]